ncbi:MAG: glutathione S-transferase [Myxococcota bacterium]
MNRPILYIFAISHYCEKARWALDYLDIDYELHALAPGAHVRKARSMGLKHGALPILAADGEVIQGSADIVSWAEANATGSRSLSSADTRDQCLTIERRLDDILGVHLRRYYYSEALVEYPATVRPIFQHRLSAFEAFKLQLAWPIIRKFMIKGMDLGPEQRRDSLDRLAGELDWLDGQLGDGRRFLVGDNLSRADIAAASLLAPIIKPETHPEYHRVILPPKFIAETAHWNDRPTLRYVHQIYTGHRL